MLNSAQKYRNAFAFRFVILIDVNPAVTAILADAGTLALRRGTGEAYIKTDAGETTNWTLLSSSSGVGGGYPVLGADPGAPVEDQTWTLRQAPNNPTATATIVDAMNRVVEIDVPNPTIADLIALGDGEELFTVDWLADMMSSPPSIDNIAPGAIQISYDGGTVTVQNVVDALNTYSQAQIGKDIAAVGGDVIGGDNFGASVGGAMGGVPIAKNGFGSIALKIFTGGVTVTIIETEAP